MQSSAPTPQANLAPIESGASAAIQTTATLTDGSWLRSVLIARLRQGYSQTRITYAPQRANAKE